MRKLHQTEVKDILRHREEKLKNIHQKMVDLHIDLRRNEELLSSVALPSPILAGMPSGKGEHRDLGDILVKYERQRRKHNSEIREIMWQLVETEDRINRVWACFHALAEPYYTLLKELYVENQLYETVENSFHVSHKTFEKQRQEGIRTIILLFESDFAVADLMRQGFGHAPIKKKDRKSEKETGYRQMHMEDLPGFRPWNP